MPTRRRLELRWRPAHDPIMAALEHEATLMCRTLQEHILYVIVSRYNAQQGVPTPDEPWGLSDAPVSAADPTREPPDAGAAAVADQYL